ncbi:hypothetical protein GW17_00053635 [Ensete ventricosum]|uniref:Uncharacterized protein n=1 Tax=Ensete ventricosum TaxID=4639 RepID=A0A444CFH7_ENSVE|nr:hypothetical protein GW17_00053635 [Ensete ventricosum]RZR73442.1 hypothetical protein BHM03_00024196 [Ensete ventricosum]
MHIPIDRDLSVPFKGRLVWSTQAVGFRGARTRAQNHFRAIENKSVGSVRSFVPAMSYKGYREKLQQESAAVEVEEWAPVKSASLCSPSLPWNRQPTVACLWLCQDRGAGDLRPPYVTPFPPLDVGLR